MKENLTNGAEKPRLSNPLPLLGAQTQDGKEPKVTLPKSFPGLLGGHKLCGMLGSL